MWNVARFFLFCCFFSVQCNAFHLCRSHSLFHSLAKQCINSTMKKEAPNYYIISDTNVSIFYVIFFPPFHNSFQQQTETKKTQAHFYAEIWFFFCITCEHLFLCTQSIVNQQRNYDWSHRLLLHYNKKRQQRKK